MPTAARPKALCNGSPASTAGFRLRFASSVHGTRRRRAFVTAAAASSPASATASGSANLVCRFARKTATNDNSGLKSLRFFILALLAFSAAIPALNALEKQPASAYHARRVALADKLQAGVAVLFAAEEPVLDFDPYRQDEDFYYLTGWNEPGAALLVISSAPESPSHRTYSEILFLPTRDLRTEKYTGAKLDAASTGVVDATGVDQVQAMTELPGVLNRLIAADPRLARGIWAQPSSPQARALLGWTATTLGKDPTAAPHDVTTLTMPLREVKE